MSKLKFDAIGERYYETGCDHGVLYVQENGQYQKGVVWNGLTSVTESPSGAEPNDTYADNIKYFTLRSAETFGATIECFTYPKEFGVCNGESELTPGITLGQQRRRSFGFSYRTKKGNDTEGDDYGYLLHIVYGATVSPAEKSYETINDSPSAITMSYEVSSTPVDVKGVGPDGKPFKPVSSITINSTVATRAQMEAIEAVLYGTDGTTTPEEKTGKNTSGTEARLPLPDELKKIFEEAGTTTPPSTEGNEEDAVG